MLQWHHLHRLGSLVAWLAAALQAPAWLDFYTRDLGHAAVQAAVAAAPTGALHVLGREAGSFEYQVRASVPFSPASATLARFAVF